MRIRSWFSMIIVTIVGILVISGVTQQHRGSAQEREDILQAEQAVVSILATATSQKGQHVCTDAPLACIGPDRGELAISLIAARNSTESLNALAGLVRFNLDGGLAEHYDCQVLSKGLHIEKALRSLSATTLRKRCDQDYAAVLQANPGLLDDAKRDGVCRSVQRIQSDVRASLEAISHSRHCD